MSEKYKNLKVKELQELLQKNGIPHSGKKEDLIERLVKNDERKALEKLEKEFELDGDFDESKLGDLPPIDLDKQINHKESVLSDDDDDDFLAITAPIKAPEPVKKVEVIKKAVEEKVEEVVPAPAPVTASSFKFIPIVYESKTATVTESTTKKAPTTSTTTKSKSTLTTTKTATVTKTKKVVTQVKDTKAAEELAEKIRKEAEKKLERSKRFGIKLDEKDMKEIRAARFGTVNKPEEPTKKENKKVVEKKDSFQDALKKRAERFGIPEKKAVATPAKDNKKTTTHTKQATKKTPVKGKTPVNKKVAQKDITKIKAGRVQKVVAKPVNNKNTKKVTLNNVTKNTVLNKKQNNVNKKLAEGAITQKKKNIVNNRKVNITNNNLQQRQKGGRMIAFAPNPTVKQQQQQQQPTKRQSSATNARNLVIYSPKRANNIGNGRTIVIADKPNTTPITNKPNNNNNKNRKRGRGPESNHYSKDKKRRN